MTGAWWWVRVGLVCLTLLNLTLAMWILLESRHFYDLAGVNVNMPYNEHLLQDFGAMNLALALLFGTVSACARATNNGRSNKDQSAMRC